MLDAVTSVKKLKSFAKSEGISIRVVGKKHFKNHVAGAVAYYSHNNKSIVLCTESVVNALYAYVLAHEIGHALDFIYAGKIHAKLFCDMIGYSNFLLKNNMKLPKKLYKFLMLREVSAFNLGEDLLKKLSIKLSKTLMKKMRNNSLRLYKAFLLNE